MKYESLFLIYDICGGGLRKLHIVKVILHIMKVTLHIVKNGWICSTDKNRCDILVSARLFK